MCERCMREASEEAEEDFRNGTPNGVTSVNNAVK